DAARGRESRSFTVDGVADAAEARGVESRAQVEGRVVVEESYSSAVGDVCGERGVRGGVGRESVARARDEVVAARGDDRGGERKERRARGRAQRPIRDR